MLSRTYWKDYVFAVQENQCSSYSFGKSSSTFPSILAYSVIVAALTFMIYDIILSSGQEVTGWLVQVSLHP